MNGPVELIGLFLAGIGAGIVNTLAGGGSFLALAALVWAGLPPHVANATNRVGVLLQSGVAYATLRAQPTDEAEPAHGWAEFGVVAFAALLGASAAVAVDPKAFAALLGPLLIMMVAASLARPAAWSERGEPSAWRWPALAAAGFYGGFLQAGVGLLLLPAFVMLGGLEATTANRRKVAFVGGLTVPALAVYASQGLVAVQPAVALALGSALGGFLGARFSLAGGAKLIRWAVAGVVVLTAIRLWF
ncbi:MAG: sulfite exporter TauE/SafE family protein [Myxococcota bacterium]